MASRVLFNAGRLGSVVRQLKHLQNAKPFSRQWSSLPSSLNPVITNQVDADGADFKVGVFLGLARSFVLRKNWKKKDNASRMDSLVKDLK